MVLSILAILIRWVWCIHLLLVNFLMPAEILSILVDSGLA